MRIFFIVLLLAFVVLGCGKSVKYKVSDNFTEQGVRRVAVLPIGGVVTDARIKSLFTRFSIEMVTRRGYEVVELKDLQDFARQSGLSQKTLDREALKALGERAGVDGFLLVEVTRWDKSFFASYASLKVGTEIALYSSLGDKLWRAKYRTKESDFRFDKEALELGVLTVYEPRIERIVDTLFRTLPNASVDGSSQKRPGGKKFFDWL